MVKLCCVLGVGIVGVLALVDVTSHGTPNADSCTVGGTPWHGSRRRVTDVLVDRCHHRLHHQSGVTMTIWLGSSWGLDADGYAGSNSQHDHLGAICLPSRRAKIVSTRGRAIMIAPASNARPRTVVIEASRCWDQVHWSSTSAPLGSPVNGATTTQPTKSHPRARYQDGRLRGLTDRRSRRLIASGTTHTK